MVRGEWEPEAENWVRWARTPGHDAYWYYRDLFFDAIVPAPGRRTLEVGCGEGRVARDLAVRGHRVAGIDTAHGLLRHAAADRQGSYVQAGGTALPFADGCFEIVVAYNSLQVVDDMPGTVREISRTLVAGGSLCACVAHPVTDLGRFVGDAGDRTFELRSDYFVTRRVEDTVESDGLRVTLRGWTYSLEQYLRALELADLQITALREPRPTVPPAKFERWQDIPLFLFFRAQKL